MAENRGVNKSAEARVVCLAPDVCWTPMGTSMVRVAYSIESRFNVAENTAQSVNFGGLPVFNMGSHLPNVTGDELGVGGGIISGVHLGCCKPVPNNHSTTVKIENQWLIRHGDLMDMNCNGPNGKANTIGRIVYIGVKPMAYVNSDGNIVTIQETTDPETGEKTVRRTEVTRDPKTGHMTEKTETTFTDPKTGETVVQSTEVTRDPLTGQVTSATAQNTTIDPKTGQIKTEKLSMSQDQLSGDLTKTAESGDFNPNQNNYAWHQKSQTVPGQYPTASDLEGQGPGKIDLVIGDNAVGTQDAFGRTNLGDGVYSSPSSKSDYQPPASEPELPIDITDSEPELPIDIADDDPELLNHPEYKDAVQAEIDALKESERINKELAWEATKTAVDLAGLIDPSPTADTVGAAMALKEGDFLGAGLSIFSAVIPYAGDAIAKPIKGLRTAKKVAELTQSLSKLTAKLDKFKDAKQKVINRIKEALKRKRAPNKAPDSPTPKKPGDGGDGGKVVKKRGNLTGDPNDIRKLKPHEKEMIDELLNRGHDVEVLPNPQNIISADILVDGVKTEMKTVFKDGANTLKNAIEGAFEQASGPGERILIDATRAGISPEKALNEIIRANGNIGGLAGRVTVWTPWGDVNF